MSFTQNLLYTAEARLAETLIQLSDMERRVVELEKKLEATTTHLERYLELDRARVA